VASQRKARWIWVALLVLTGISPILAEIFNANHCGNCGVTLPGYSPVLGITSVGMGILLLLEGRYRQHFQRFVQIQDCIFAIGFILAGVLLFSKGWRLDRELLLACWVFVESTIYWVFKDIYR
jgi:CDP-diglyceride synthetase